MVVDKQGEIAILQTQGLTKRQVMQVFMLQGIIVGIIGALLGGALGVLISTNLNSIVSVFPLGILHLPSEINSAQIAMIIGGSVLLSLLCTLYPAYQAAKVEPAQALRYE
jgi:lipoprotein-releasing system permease protein